MEELSEQDEYLPFGEPAHYIQRDILTVLKEAVTPLSYSEIKPKEIDGNAFNHHLRTLVSKGILFKNEENRYALTAREKRGIDFYSLADTRLKIRPISGVFVLVKSTDEMILTYKNEAAPIGGHVGLLFGKLRLSESYDKTLDRILKRRGLVPKSIYCKASVNILYYHNDELVAQRCGPLFMVELMELANQDTEYMSSTQKLKWEDPNNINSEEILTSMRLSGASTDNYLDLSINV